MNQNKFWTFLFAIIIVFNTSAIAQSSLSLEEVLNQILANSPTVTQAELQKSLSDSRYKLFRSQFNPTLGLTASLPGYSKTSSPIIQPDGSIAFQSIRQSNASVSIYGSQTIRQTGGQLFVTSDLQRFNNLSDKIVQYNGIPIRLGINQPLNGYNPFKHDEAIEKMELTLAKSNYNAALEGALAQGVELFFNILIAKQNLETSKTNTSVNQKLLAITQERLNLGKVSKDELLQLEIELAQSELFQSQASFALDHSIAVLFTFLGKKTPTGNLNVVETQAPKTIEVNLDQLISSSRKSRPEYLIYEKTKKELRRDKKSTKSEYGLQANLQASIGLARGSDNIETIYKNPLDEQQFNIALQIPILDFGKKKHALEQIKIRTEDNELKNDQLMLEMDNEIRQSVLQIKAMGKELKLLESIKSKAEERFSISTKRYTLGNLDITNLTLAQRERDQARRNYIQTLKQYWTTYYNIRLLTGYDILNNKTINYDK